MNEANQEADPRRDLVGRVYARLDIGLFVFGMVPQAAALLRTPAGPDDWIAAHLRFLRLILPLRIAANIAAILVIVVAFVFGYGGEGARADWFLYAVIGGFGIEILTRLDYQPRMQKAAEAFARRLPPGGTSASGAG